MTDIEIEKTRQHLQDQISRLQLVTSDLIDQLADMKQMT